MSGDPNTMNQRQFERLKANRRSYQPAPLFNAADVGTYLRRALRVARGLTEARAAWEAVMPTALCEQTRVEEFTGGRLRVWARDGVTADVLRTQGPSWQRLLAARLPGLRALQVEVRLRPAQEGAGDE